MRIRSLLIFLVSFPVLVSSHSSDTVPKPPVPHGKTSLSPSEPHDIQITTDIDDESDSYESNVIDTNENGDNSFVMNEDEKDDELLFEITSSEHLPELDSNEVVTTWEDENNPEDSSLEQLTRDNLIIESSEESDDLWERIRSGFRMPEMQSSLVKREEHWYTVHSDTALRIFERARPFLHYIVDQIQKNGMPTELALIPIVESAYNPFALSPAHASGLWQFIPSTGKKYKLSQNWFVDQRRDIVASTKAALSYFSKLHDQFGDWHISLAAYNWGEAGVENSIRRNKLRHLPTDYVHLRMPNETRHYFPRLQALKNIIRNPKAFGLSLPPIENKPYLVAVELSSTLDIPTAAQLAELPIKKFLELNPSFNRPLMQANENKDKKENTYVLLLPYNKRETFFQNLDTYRRRHKSLTHWHLYYIYQKKSISSVAKKFGIKPSQILLSNGLKADTHWIRGRVLIPDSAHPLPDAIQKQMHRYLANSVSSAPVRKRRTRTHHHFIHSLRKTHKQGPFHQHHRHHKHR